MDREVNPHSTATLSFDGSWQEASLKSVPSNKQFNFTAAMCSSKADNLPPTCRNPPNRSESSYLETHHTKI